MLGAMLLVGLLSAASTPGPKPVLQQPFRVVLDAGHGGSNSGCHTEDGSIYEKDIALALAQDVARAVRERLPHAQVVMTRSDDRTLALADRVMSANGGGADVFVSLHANASPRHDQTGFETFVLDAEASSKEAALVARRENAAETTSPPVGGATPQAQAMVDQLRASAHRAGAIALAQAIQTEQARRFPKRADRGVRQASFDVLLGVRMPAVLFEAGFLDHAADKTVLLDEEQRREVADGIAAALVEHYRRTSRGASRGG
jgi:N-acetylmuramoyl-L-alanine amidase